MADTFTIAAPKPFFAAPTKASVPAPANPKAPDSTGPAIAKRKQSKSRNGCITCKAKRLKCDETKPTCKQCSRRSVACGGYRKDFKWRPFEETAFAPKPAPAKTKKTSDPPSSSSAPLPFAPPYQTSAGTRHAAPRTHNGFQNAYYPPPQPHQPPPSQLPLGHNIPTFMNPMYAVPMQQPYPFAPPPVSPIESFPPGSDSAPSIMETDSLDTRPTKTTVASSVSSGHSPRLVDLLLPGTDLNDLPEEYMSFREQHEAFYQPTGLTPPADVTMEDQIEEVPRSFGTDQSMAMIRLPSPAPSTSSSSSSDSKEHPLYVQPGFASTSTEMLLKRFDRETCGVLSVKDGPTENPWRTLIWPLARDCPALYHAIASMTSFHHSKDLPALRIQGIDHMRTAVHALASSLENMRVDAAISTTLTLAFSESWDQHISTGINHIKGARILIDRALVQHNQNPVRGEDLARLKFLCNLWVYVDVIARLTSADTDDASDYDLVFDSFNMGDNSESQLDPLMGCAQTLFPIIGRVANLVRKVRRTDSNSPTIISEAMDLKLQLENWMPPSYIEDPEDESTSPHDSIKTATAYQYATLLYLHQAVPEVPSLPSAVLAKKIVCEIATVHTVSRATIVHIYPLMAAGCELVDPADRDWIRNRWEVMFNRMKLGILEKCLDVTKEVWLRRDEYASENCLDPGVIGVSFGTPSLKRQFSSISEEHDDDDDDDLGWDQPAAKRRAVDSIPGFEPEGDFCWLDPARRRTTGSEVPRRVPVRSEMSGGLRTSEVLGTETLHPDFTVKGRLHWLGVMKDWNWEILLG